MQVTETLSDGLKRGFTVVVPAADIESRRSKRSWRNWARPCGCPASAPARCRLTVVRQRYGTAVTAEVLEEAVNEATQQVLTDRGLRPAGQPKVELVSRSRRRRRRRTWSSRSSWSCCRTSRCRISARSS